MLSGGKRKQLLQPHSIPFPAGYPTYNRNSVLVIASGPFDPESPARHFDNRELAFDKMELRRPVPAGRTTHFAGLSVGLQFHNCLTLTILAGGTAAQADKLRSYRRR